jgi:hypothetical protein
MYPRNIPPLTAIIWSAAATGSATTSTTNVNLQNCPYVSVFGNVSGATTITLMLSIDGTNFYAGPTVTTSGAGNFYLNATVGAVFVALQSSSNVTATAVISAR